MFSLLFFKFRVANCFHFMCFLICFFFLGWPNNNQYRPPQYGNSGAGAGAGGASSSPQVSSGQQQWPQGPRPATGQWDRYPGAVSQGYQPPPNQQQQQQGQQWSPGMPPAPGGGLAPSLRPPPLGVGGVPPRPGKPFPLLPAPGASKCGQPPQVAAATTYSQNQLPKREITFPPDSVEATLPVLYRRKRLCRGDLGPVDPWRIIMCLRSGLLSESTYALDILNVLLFDDSSVGYFGLSQWPGLLDILLEHFQKALSDIFDGPFPRPYEPDETEVDLGGVVKPIDGNLKTVLLHNTSNYTLVSRKGFPVRLLERGADIFIQDHPKDWDIRGETTGASIVCEMVTDPWQSKADHILPTFQAEFCRIPFNKRLKDEENKTNATKTKSTTEREIVAKEEVVQRQQTPPPEAAPPPPKASDKKRRTKTLSDVISRIKKDTSEANGVLTLDAMTGATPTTQTTDKVKTEVVTSEKANCDEQEHQQRQSVDLNVVGGSSSSSSVNGECGKSGSDDASSHREQQLKRRRASDCEDEAYTRDEASLVLITESQDNVGKRCVCISNIIRSLTFVPGNEGEFARNSTFLAIAGKLFLLHHEHPPRTQKTRNYDREVSGRHIPTIFLYL